ncbi:phosphatases II, partial [Hesseltinella vesiculosa]
ADLIVPRLYLGNLVSGRSLHWLQRRNISHVLAIGCGYDRHGQHIKYMNLSVGDTRYDNLLEHFDDTFAFIEQGRWQGTGVLVHCLAGQSRSATVVAAYLMAKGGMHHHRALHMIRLRRPSIRPRSSFICQL